MCEVELDSVIFKHLKLVEFQIQASDLVQSSPISVAIISL